MASVWVALAIRVSVYQRSKGRIVLQRLVLEDAFVYYCLLHIIYRVIIYRLDSAFSHTSRLLFQSVGPLTLLYSFKL